MKVIVTMGHPAHFHLFKNVVTRLIADGHVVKVVITEKDVLKALLLQTDFDFEVLAQRKKNEGKLDKLKKLYYSTKKLIKIVDLFSPDIMIGCIYQMAWVGKIMQIPVVFCNEDDISYIRLQCMITYPFVSAICAPLETKVGIFKGKKITYKGFQKLAYLHPATFKPDAVYLPEIDINKPYFIIRLVSLDAYHDNNINGLSNNILKEVIEKLEKIGVVYITSENDLPEYFVRYNLPVNVEFIHHALYYSSLYIGDSQSMAVEAAMLGVPNIRYNDFAGRISVLEKIQIYYGLTYSFNTSQPEMLLQKIDELIGNINIKNEFQNKRKKLLEECIDVNAFLVWFIENYPESKKIMQKNPDYQYRFK